MPGSAADVFTAAGKTMARRLRIARGPDVGDILDSIESLEAFARNHGPGRYDVDEHSLDPFPGSKVSARAWGTVIHQPDGRIAVKPYFFGDNFAAHIGRLNYRACPAAGKSIGSGVVEGAAKTLGLRLKARGARWTNKNARAMAALVCARNGDEWSCFWNKAA
jgi:hypothetical protein